jgi:hypothetical protein
VPTLLVKAQDGARGGRVATPRVSASQNHKHKHKALARDASASVNTNGN